MNISKLLAPKMENEASAFLQYGRHVSPEIITVGTHAFMTTFEVEGVAYETADSSELNRLRDALNNVLISLADERLSIWTHMVRTRERGYPDGKYWTKFAHDLNDHYREKMTGEQLYKNRWFITLIWNPAADSSFKAKSFFARLASARKSDTEADPDAIRALEDKARDLAGLLDRYGLRQLSIYQDDELLFSEPMEFLQLIASLDSVRMPVVDGPIHSAVILNRPFFGRESIELRGAGSSRYVAMLGVNTWSAKTKPGQLNELLSAPLELMIAQSFVFKGLADARTIMTRKQNQMLSAGDKAISQIDDLDEALDDLESRRLVMGEAHLNVAVFANSPKDLLDNAAIVRRMMTDASIIVAREDLALEAAYWGMFPGNVKQRPRSGTITSRNFAALSGFHCYPTGRLTNIWGAAVALLKTSAGTPFYFNFHWQDLGSTLIIGKSGSGKTVLQNFFLAQAQKLDPTIIFFDKDRGAELFVRAAGGTYLSLENGLPTGCAPLKALDLTDEGDIAFLRAWISKLVERSDRPFTVAEQREIDLSVTRLALLPKAERTLKNLRQFFAFQDEEGVGARLERWIEGGSLAWVFDGDDHLALDAKFMGFDMTQFLDNPEIRTPLMMYLMHRITKLLDGRRIIIDIDEFWKALGDPYFVEFIKNLLKTIRKQNGLMVFGTQEPDDAIKSEIGSTIISQVGTMILTPNNGAKKAAYVDGLNLTYKEYELIRDVITPESRRFIIKQGHNSVIAELNLNGFDHEMPILSGRTEAVNQCAEIREQLGSDDPDLWMPILLGKQKLEGAKS